MTAQDRIKARIRELVAIPSVSSASPAHDQSNRRVVERLGNWLDDLGFRCEVLDVPSQPEKCNLVATLGEGEDGLVLSGHTDTVPYDEGAWHSDPFELDERDGRLYGLGSCDMKGFLALAVEAAGEVAGRRLKRPLTIVGTADEESGMDGARALAQAGRPRARYAVIGEPTGLRPIRVHKGIFMDAIQVRGHAGHSSNPSLGLNAIEGMHRVMTALLRLRDELVTRQASDEFNVVHSTLNLGRIHGGDSPNRIPAACELFTDLRFLPGQTLASLREELRGRAREALAGSRYELDFRTLFEGTPAFETAPDAEIVRVAEALTGNGAGAVDFATEGAFFNGMGMQTVVLGPGHIDQAHQPDEYLETAFLEPAMQVLRGLIERFCL